MRCSIYQTSQSHRSVAALLESFDLVQSVSQSTDKDRNTLDLVITRSDNKPNSYSVDPPLIISDQALVVCRFSSVSVAVRKLPSTTRSWKKVDRNAFNHALASSLPCNANELRGRSAEDLFEPYDSTLRRLADKFVPERTIVLYGEICD